MIAGKTFDDMMADRGLLPGRVQAAEGIGPSLMEILGQTSPMDAPADDAGVEQTIEELLLSSDEPLRVLAMPEELGGFGIFCGIQQVGGTIAPWSSYPATADDYAAWLADQYEVWRAAVRKQRASQPTTDAEVGG